MLPISFTGEYLQQWLLVYRVISVLIANVHATDAMTPKNIIAQLRLALQAIMTIISSFLQLVPLKNYPRLSIFHRVLSIPSQIYTLYVANAYIAPFVQSTFVTMGIVITTIMSVVVTAFGIWTDTLKIEHEK